MKYAIVLVALLALTACKKESAPVDAPVAPPVGVVSPDKAMTMEELGPKPAGGSAGYPDWVKACDRITGAFCN